MVDDYDYRIDDVDLELMCEVAQRIQDEWDGSHSQTDNVEMEEV